MNLSAGFTITAALPARTISTASPAGKLVSYKTRADSNVLKAGKAEELKNARKRKRKEKTTLTRYPLFA